MKKIEEFNCHTTKHSSKLDQKNVKHYLDNINTFKNIPSKLIFYIISIYLSNNSSISKDNRDSWVQQLNNITLISKDIRQNIFYIQNDLFTSVNNSFIEKANKYLENIELVMVQDYKWKFLCDLMLFYYQIVVVEEKSTNSLTKNDNTSTINEYQTQICQLLKSFLFKNKTLISIKNLSETNEIKLFFEILYVYLKNSFERDTFLYSEITNICFRYIDEDTLQLNNLQEIIDYDYLTYNFIQKVEILQNNPPDIILKQITYISKFIFYNEIPNLFVNILSILKQRIDFF